MGDLTHIALWLFGWAAAMAVGGFILVVIVRIIIGAAAEVWVYLLYVAAVIVRYGSPALAEFIIEGIRLSIFFSVEWMARMCAPLNRKWNEARNTMDAEREWRAMVNKPNPVKQAKQIMGLPDEFTATDLKARHRDLMKRVHPDSGGTDWLGQQVNWANGVLKKVATR